MGKWFIFIFSLIGWLTACAPVISKQALREADPALSFQELLRDPEAYRGKVLLLGGRILTTTLKEGETWVEVLQQPLDWQQKPEETDVSHGRFLLRFADFRDPAVYAAERNITILGEVLGKKVQPIKDLDYPYPVLIPRESHLWEPGRPTFHFGIGVGGTIR